jgi:hypothetical protein
MLVLRTAFLSLHVAGGVLGLLLGGFALHPPRTHRFRLLLRRAYAAAILVLAVFLVATVLVDWPGLAAIQRIVFAVLVGLAAFIVARVFLANRAARLQPTGWEAAYMNHIYFSYISLWEGFFIVGLLDLGAPPWLIGAVAVGVVILGAVLFSAYRRRLDSTRIQST